MRLASGIQLERTTEWTAVTFERPRPVLSSAPVGGGDALAARIVNLWVDGPGAGAACADPAGTFARLAASRGWSGETVGLMTGVPPGRLALVRLARDPAGWTVLATAGTRNAHHAGEPAPAPAPAAAAGTINVIAITGQGLTGAARAEAIGLVAEAKASILTDLDVWPASGEGQATGTGTDATAVVCGDANDVSYTGHHTDSGVELARAVREAIARSLALGPAATPGG